MNHLPHEPGSPNTLVAVLPAVHGESRVPNFPYTFAQIHQSPACICPVHEFSPQGTG
jgi:hypothetical protein